MTGSSHVHFGAQGVDLFLDSFLALGAPERRLFLVAGRHSYEASGAAAALAPFLADISVTRFSDFSSNPKIDDLGRALTSFRKSGARSLLAVGGGSAMDIGKLINYFASTQVDPEAYVRGERGRAKAFFPLLAVPTTAGSGSEATHFAVLYDGFSKLSVADPALIPSSAWLNATFTESLSPYQTACSGFDALAQAMESYWAVGSTVESMQDSISALRLCLEHLEGAVLKPTTEHRAGMLEAAHLAGRAINVAKTTAAHALSYAMTGHYKLAHGHAVALTLPAVFEANAAVTDLDVNDSRGVTHVRDAVQRLCALLDSSSAITAVSRLRNMMTRIGLSPTWFGDHEVDLTEVRTHILQEVNQERLGNNPRRFTPELIAQVVAQIQ